MVDPQERYENMLDVLKGRGFRLTPQRLAVVRLLADGTGHPSVEQLYESVAKDFPTTSLATVYKTVALLKELGEVMELSFPGGGNRYDGVRPYPHPHLICVRCGQILDPGPESMQDLYEELAAETGYEILSHRLDFFGICPGCRGQGPSEGRSALRPPSGPGHPAHEGRE
ncbi:MAG: transcriptional repressor [Deltaproteobacteria bacterium]|nr:transcriptional repressor [Deltaproteobacteria bacterium]